MKTKKECEEILEGLIYCKKSLTEQWLARTIKDKSSFLDMTLAINSHIAMLRYVLELNP